MYIYMYVLLGINYVITPYENITIVFITIFNICTYKYIYVKSFARCHTTTIIYYTAVNGV